MNAPDRFWLVDDEDPAAFCTAPTRALAVAKLDELRAKHPRLRLVDTTPGIEAHAQPRQVQGSLFDLRKAPTGQGSLF